MMFFLSDEMPFSFDELLLFGAASGGKLIEDTATGNPLTFTTDVAKALKSLTIPFLPIQSGTGDPSPSNVRNIVPWNGLRLVQLDENLLSINRTSAQNTQGITYTPIKRDNKTVAVQVKGERTNTNPFFNLNWISGTSLAIEPGTYKISGGTAEVRIQVFYHDANGVEKLAGYDDGSGATVTIPADSTASWCRLLTWTDNPVDEVIYPIIASENATITETDISFPSAVYGGTLDAVTGVLTVEWMGITLDGSSDESWSVAIQTSGLYRAVFSSTSFIGGIPKSYSRLFANYFKNTTAVEVGSAWIGSTSNMLCFIPEGMTTLAQWRSYLSENNLQLVYELDEPQTVQLTPQQITALVGNNTIWSDADGTMSAVYLKKA